jgi:SAM-dependent methyltransferase
MMGETQMDAKDYLIIAKYYDETYGNRPDLNDLPFYLELAREQGGPVLEIACGTGRILLEVARQGIPITGIDYSEDMLSILKAKLKREPQKVQSLIDLHLGDMRNFRLEKRFRLITIPFRSFQHLYTIEDQLSALRTAKAHLDPSNGLLAFNLFYPDYAMLESGINKEVFDFEWADPSNSEKTIRRYFVRQKVNKLEQYFEGAFLYKSYEQGIMTRQETAPLKMGYYTYPQMLLLFEQTGLEIVNEYGSFDKEPIDICKEMIFVLRAKRS